MTTLFKVKMTDAQRAALSMRGLDEVFDEVDQLILRCWPEKGDHLIFKPEEQEELWDALNEHSNAEDSEYWQNPKGEMAKFARRASRSLSNLASRVVRAGRTKHTTIKRGD